MLKLGLKTDIELWMSEQVSGRGSRVPEGAAFHTAQHTPAHSNYSLSKVPVCNSLQVHEKMSSEMEIKRVEIIMGI